MRRGPSNTFLTRRARLRARICRDFDIVDRDLVIDDLVIPFTLVRDPDAVLDQIVNEADRREKLKGKIADEDELHLPYWAELWDSAIGVGHWLVEEGSGFGVQGSAKTILSVLNPEPRTLNPPRTLDLGCGMGLAGTVASALGHRVLFADIETPALLFARHNALQFDPHVRARRVDWKKDRLGEKFDLILGADVLYDKTQWEFLEPFCDAHLARNGRIILGEPGRQTGEMFVEWLSAGQRWSLTRSEVAVATRDTPIKLLLLSRSEKDHFATEDFNDHSPSV